MSGRFITFEGTEGSGKSTQIRILAERLRTKGFRVLEIREPGGTLIGEEIRDTVKRPQHKGVMTPETELLLMNASRAQLVREVIQPALQNGEFVLCDRFYDSTVAYQAYGRGLDPGVVQGIIDFAVGNVRPDHTFLLQIPIKLSEARRLQRNQQTPTTSDRFEQDDSEFFERVGQGFQAIALADPERVKVIEGSLPIAAVSSEIWKHMEGLIA